MMTSKNILQYRIPENLNLNNRQNNRLLYIEKEILEAVATGVEPQRILDSLCHAAESIVENSSCSIMLFNSSRQSLYVRSAPSISDDAIEQLNGLIPGPEAGSCGTAVYSEVPVYVKNTTIDPRWINLQKFASNFDIAACWSHPIKAKDGLIMGSFALSSNEQREPDNFQKRVLDVVANIAGIILQREIQEQALWELAHHDLVIGIPNRILLNQRLKHAIKQSARQNQNLALFFIDLDNFKTINDTYGHKTGDKVLIETSKRIQSCIRTNDTLSRYGGDEFVLLTENITDCYNIGLIAEKILNAFTKPVYINDKEIDVTPSIGISVYPDDGESADVLLSNADTAMYQAKTNGRNKYICYKPELTYNIQNKLKLEAELKTALLNNEFILHYQPQHLSSSDSSLSVEALIRWQHPKRGLLYPVDFIPVAEQSTLIKEIGKWVLQESCRQGKVWLDRGLKLNKIAINISAMQILKGCHTQISTILNEYQFPAEKLEIEITESLMVQQNKEVLTELHLIQSSGISIALDDFGTGYSSLSQLQLLPFNKLKIDRSFVSDIPGNKNDEIIVKTIIAMGKNLSLTVIAEGVENQEQADFLLKEGCDVLQGYLFSKPLSVAGLEKELNII